MICGIQRTTVLIMLINKSVTVSENANFLHCPVTACWNYNYTVKRHRTSLCHTRYFTKIETNTNRAPQSTTGSSCDIPNLLTSSYKVKIIKLTVISVYGYMKRQLSDGLW